MEQPIKIIVEQMPSNQFEWAVSTIVVPLMLLAITLLHAYWVRRVNNKEREKESIVNTCDSQLDFISKIASSAQVISYKMAAYEKWYEKYNSMKRAASIKGTPGSESYFENKTLFNAEVRAEESWLSVAEESERLQFNNALLASIALTDSQNQVNLLVKAIVRELGKEPPSKAQIDSLVDQLTAKVSELSREVMAEKLA